MTVLDLLSLIYPYPDVMFNSKETSKQETICIFFTFQKGACWHTTTINYMKYYLIHEQSIPFFMLKGQIDSLNKLWSFKHFICGDVFLVGYDILLR